MFCPKCGNEIADKASFCPKCGAGIAANAKQEISEKTSEPTQPSAKKNMSKYIGIAAVLLVALLVVTQMGGHGNDGESVVAVKQEAAVQQKRQPANFEEWVSVNRPDYPNDLRNRLLTGAALVDALDVQVSVSGNQVSIVIYDNIASSDVGWGMSLLNTFGQSFLDEATKGEALKGFSNIAAECQSNSGFPVKVHVEERYSDGALMQSYDFTAEGRIN